MVFRNFDTLIKVFFVFLIRLLLGIAKDYAIRLLCTNQALSFLRIHYIVSSVLYFILCQKWFYFILK